MLTIITLSVIPGHTQAQPPVAPTTIEQTKSATVAILKNTHTEGNRHNQNHFSIRGTGFHLHDGYIITVGHATEQLQGSHTKMAEEIHVLTQEFFEIPATFVGFNAVLDIAVYKLTLQDPQLPVTRFASEEATTGQKVYSIGYPLGWGPALGFGTVGNLTTFLPTVPTRLHQVDLSTCRGNSGGGLFNQEGAIVGVIHAIIQTETTEGDRRCSRFAFAIPGKLVERIVTALIQGEVIKFSSLGLQLTTIQTNYQWKVAVAKASGPAKAGGIRKGDIIISVDKHPIHSSAELKTYLIEQTIPGQTIMVEIHRGTVPLKLPVTLGGL